MGETIAGRTRTATRIRYLPPSHPTWWALTVNTSPKDKELLQRIDEVLYYRWDPLSVSDSPAARDEYESYVPRVFQLLKSTADGSEVADYLHWLATEHMGVGAGRKRDVEIVALLLSWRDQLSE